MSQQDECPKNYSQLGQVGESPQELIKTAKRDLSKAKDEERELAQVEENEGQEGGFGFADLKKHASKVTGAVKSRTQGMRATLKKKLSPMGAALKKNTVGLRSSLKRGTTALTRKAPMSADKLPRTNYLLWLGAGMSRVAYNSPLMMYAMLDALVSNEGSLHLGTRFGSISKAIKDQGGDPFALPAGGASSPALTAYNWTQQEMIDATKMINDKFDNTFKKFLTTPPSTSEYRGTKDNKLNSAFWDFGALKQGVRDKVLQTAHYKVVYLHTSEDLSCYIVASKLNNSIFIVYRGSRSLKNWKTNFTMMAANNADYEPCSDAYQLYANPDVKMFPGFLKRDMEAMHTTTMMAGYLAKDFLKASPVNKAKVFTFGHSLGGALCSIYSLLYSIVMNPLVGTHQMPDLANYLENSITCVSYGAPKPFNKSANVLFNAQQQAKRIFFRRVWTRGDPVEKLPVGLYIHPGTKAEDVVFPITRANMATTIMSLGTASHLEEEGISYMGLVSRRMNTLRSELKTANKGCNLSLILVMMLGPPRDGGLDVKSMVGYLPAYGIGSKNSDIDISSDAALYKDIVSRLQADTKGTIMMEKKTPSTDRGVTCQCTTGLCTMPGAQVHAIPPMTPPQVVDKAGLAQYRGGAAPATVPLALRDDSILRISCVPRTQKRIGLLHDRSKAMTDSAKLIADEAAIKARNVTQKVANMVVPTKLKARLDTLAIAARRKGGRAAEIVGTGAAGTARLLWEILTSPMLLITQFGSPSQTAMMGTMSNSMLQFAAFDIVFNMLGSLLSGVGDMISGGRRSRKIRRRRQVRRSKRVHRKRTRRGRH